MADNPGTPALIAGFDAGQTHTTCRLAESGTDRVLAEGKGSGVCHLEAADGPERLQAALLSSLTAARAQLAKTWADLPLRAAAVGASGIEAGSDLEQRGRNLAAGALALPAGRVLVTGDERTALRGAMGHAPAGILVISGTGTIALGRDASGRDHRCAGWGWLLDQAGSACDIGRDGLALSLAMADGRQPVTTLQGKLWQALGLELDDPGASQAIKAMVVRPDFGASGFAALAPVVAAAAAAGDGGAQAIVRRSGAALAAMVTTIAGRLQLEAPAVWTAGGALGHLPPLRAALEEALRARCPRAHLEPPAGDACDGALALARDQLHGPR